MPAENGVGCDNRSDVAQAATTQPLPMHRQPTAVRLAEADAAAHVSTQDAILCYQVRDSVLLSLVKPADERSQEHAKRERVDHGARVYTTDPTSRPRSSSAAQ
jgi:hypothetical protein